MTEKHWDNAVKHQIDSCKLAQKIYLSGWKPDYIVSLFRGGSSIGIQVQEFLRWLGWETDNISIRTSRNPNDISQVRVHGTEYFVANAQAKDKALIIDDLIDGGGTIYTIEKTLKDKMRLNCPELKVATIYYKPESDQKKRAPDYFLYDNVPIWIVLPHELTHDTGRYSLEEITKHKGIEIANMLKMCEEQKKSDVYKKIEKK